MRLNSSNIRGLLLEVPYKEKEEAKELGAWWDSELKKWFVPKGKDVRPFSRWFPKNENQEKDIEG